MASGLTAQVAGFRYFNVYGPREQHKGRMASVAFHHFNQFRETGKVRLFGPYDGYAAGTQSRDFVSVEDVVTARYCENITNPTVQPDGKTEMHTPIPDVAHVEQSKAYQEENKL